MAKHGSGEWAVLLADGYNLLGAALQGLTSKAASSIERVDGLGDTWVKNSPTGLQTASLAQTGAYFDDTLNGIHAAFAAATDVLRIVCWALTGNTIGQRFYGIQGAYGSSYSVIGKVNGLTKADVTYTVSGQIDDGVILQNQTARTASWNTKTDGASVDFTTDPTQRVIPITSATKASPCVVTTAVPHGLTSGQIVLTSGNTLSTPNINSSQAVTVISATTFSVAVDTSASTGAGTGGSFVLCSTVNGGVGYQAISAYAGFSATVGKVRHSADDTTYADLVTFADLGSTYTPTGQRVTVAGTINRYLCASGAVTGSGSVTPFQGFCRF